MAYLDFTGLQEEEFPSDGVVGGKDKKEEKEGFQAFMDPQTLSAPVPAQ